MVASLGPQPALSEVDLPLVSKYFVYSNTGLGISPGTLVAMACWSQFGCSELISQGAV